MKVDGGVGLNLSTVGAQAAELEEMGYTGVMTAETAHDPFFPLFTWSEQQLTEEHLWEHLKTKNQTMAHW